MVRVKGTYWTADFTVARALLEAYRGSGKDGLVYFCVGDPVHPLTRMGPQVGTELLKYYPHVLGTMSQPISPSDVATAWAEAQQLWPDAFFICIEATGGPADVIGFIEVSDRGLRHVPQEQAGETWIGDVSVTAYLWEGNPPAELTAAQFNTMQKVADAIIDGQIRFLQNVKKYQPEL